MAKKKEFVFQPLSERKQRPEPAPDRKSAPARPRMNVRAKIPAKLHDHLVSYVYHERSSQDKVIELALTKYLADKPNEPLPEEYLNRPKRGRKPKL